MNDTTFDSLKNNPIFNGLPDEALRALIADARRRTVDPSERLINAGDPGDSLLILLSGSLEVVRETADGETVLATLQPGSYVGEMALIDDTPRSATVRATTRSDLLEITRHQFDTLLASSPNASRALVRTVLRRLRSTEAMLVNQEKLAALGRISAGLAHELNNPASAVGRLAAHLAEAIDDWEQASVLISSTEESNVFKNVMDVAVRHSDLAQGPNSHQQSELERLEIEEALGRRLEEYGVADPWNAASYMADVGFRPETLESELNTLPDNEIPHAVRWLSAHLTIQTTLREIRVGAERIAEIVNAVKRYSHMDQAPVGNVNVNQGLETTLIILRHELRQIDVHLDLDESIPDFTGFPAEMNQVWTNLIDNAIDAMNADGQLHISTRREGDQAIIQITDSGTGIPAEQRSRLFEPFFTTKPIGVGTGLGLHIVHTIVVQRHRGTISVESVPGKTTFTVTLPLDDS